MNNNNLTKVSNESLVQFILDYKPQYSNGKDENGNSKFKHLKAKYVISGELKNGATTRTNENLLTRDALILDIDHLTRHDETVMFNNLSSSFKSIEWVAYPSINSNLMWVNRNTGVHENKGYGYRVIFSVDRPFKEDERKSLIANVCKRLGVKDDSNAEQWSQVMGLPVKNIHTKDMNKFIRNNVGQPLKVDDYMIKIAKVNVSSKPTLHTATINDDYAINLLKQWTNRHQKYLMTESNFSNILIGLVGYYQSGDITQNVLTQSMTILAMDNSNWATDNIRKLKAHFNYSANIPSKSFREFFSSGTVDRFKPVKMTARTLINRMKDTRNEWLSEINEQLKNENSNARTRKSLSPSTIAKLIKMYIPMFKTTNGDDALLCIYNFDNGIYETNEFYLAEMVDSLEENYTEKQIDAVRYKLMLRASINELEQSSMLVPVNNGIYDQENNALIPFDPSYRFLSKDATNYNKNAKEPKYSLSDGSYWTPSSLIKDLSCHDAEIENVLYEVIADSINGNFSREQAIFLLGNQNGGLSNNGSNGKGTFQDLIQGIVGDKNTSHLKADDMDKHFMINELIGKTVNIGDDLQSNVYIDNSSNFNSAVTGDVIFTDRKNKSPVSFRFKGTVIQSTNEMPSFKNKTGGTYRRMIIIPFNAHFKPSKDGKKIKGSYIKTKETREWILKKALEMPFFTEYTQPSASKELMSEFKIDNDTVRQFFNEIMSQLPIARIDSHPLYQRYQSWCIDSGYRNPLAKQTFIKQIKGILNERQKKIDSISMQAFADIAKSKNRRNDLINKNLPLIKCDFSYTFVVPIGKYASYVDDKGFSYMSSKQRRVFKFPLRELLIDTLTLYDNLPNKNSPEYDKLNQRLRDYQKRLIK
ncbi:hypothetical protein FD31_GL001244 [Companilactobacillus nantensis DSM 16982]|uniref:SF3 helicase domain-containing protein n=2 Tax=Companilactobacillus nantensis TaxID=305793 RepID=A0A0R1WCA9_9LACO|nr:hypothetical protein FD31_GL001244 [Companilactobacillus nantensis DSM 16982]